MSGQFISAFLLLYDELFFKPSPWKYIKFATSWLLVFPFSCVTADK